MTKLLFAEEVAEVIGVTGKGVIKQYLADARRAKADAASSGAEAPAGLFPEPYDTVDRPVWNGHHNITVASNRWHPGDLAAWIETRAPNSRWNAERRTAVAAQLREMLAA